MPIEDLHYDLLWKILMLNADMDDQTENFLLYSYSPLTIARRSSQVCRTWRGLILSCPSIWGRIIDLNNLAQRTGFWRDEVIRRSGESLICVKGRVDSAIVWEFFYFLLVNHWSRIQQIVVHVGIFFPPITRWKDIFSRSTQVLREFKFETSFYADLPFSSALFLNQAPSLREFDCSIVRFSLKAPWIAQLRYLVLSDYFTFQEIVDALKAMPFLESLDIKSVATPSLSSAISFPRISSPRLNSIAISKYLDAHLCLSLLEHLEPSIGCTVALTFEYSSISIKELDATNQIIGSYWHNYCNRYSLTHLTLCLTKNLLSFTHPLTVNDPLSTPFSMQITSRNQMPSQAILIFLTMLTSGRLSSIVYLDLLLLPTDLAPDTVPSVIGLLANLPLVEVLQVRYLSTLAVVHHCGKATLPSLQTIQFTYVTRITPERIVPFLKWRELIGRPIKNLDFTLCVSKALGNLGFLEHMSGLKIAWIGRFGVPRSYDCGSGRPDLLDFCKA